MADNSKKADYKTPANSQGIIKAPIPRGNTCSPKKATGGDLRAKAK